MKEVNLSKKKNPNSKGSQIKLSSSKLINVFWFKSISNIFDLLPWRVYGNSSFQSNKNNEKLYRNGFNERQNRV